MIGIGIAEIVFIGLIVTVPLVLMFLMVFAGRKGGRAPSAEETQLVQELLQGMKKLEARVDSMESILMEQRGNK